MPKRAPFPGTDILPADILPEGTSQEESDSLCLRAFFYDYGIISINPNLSRGYLSGLELLTYRQGQNSDLARACLAISFATHGKSLNRPKLKQKADEYFRDLLGSLAKAIESPSAANAAETRFIALLLGLYQIATSDENDCRGHEIHAKGLAALMGIGSSPLNLLSNHRWPQHNAFNIKKLSGVFSIPALTDQRETLDDLLLDLDSLWTRSETLFTSKDFRMLLTTSIDLNRRFAKWADSRVPGFKPTTIGKVSQRYDEADIAVGYWPVNVDTYFDLYVAGVWNIFRVARLILLSLIIKLSAILGIKENCIEFIIAGNCILEDMLATIPYHLVNNLPAFVSLLSNEAQITEPGRYLGGLLLMHPLYVVSEIPFLSEPTRVYIRKCLAWIGSNMGIGQATLLANTRDIGKDFIESGCMIIWSGFLK
ncbi:hypothetical protein K505DRAFT_246780 [Melanomma pulvis-pyrius CBS 109.77]|uniref:C6 transcription factor n=1 Tax=Melanomma pulvis-pyrius CBS 109.77 TaxID=1314802 RepID=A0A6A6X7W0_9PLEO|nr:hypothetical protein K505DRAFT_246780 [Melanomma pulvis-pyrius CBS 109.77]